MTQIRIVSAMGGAGNGQDAQQYEWKWGSRADAEIGEQVVCEFMLDMLVIIKVQRDSGVDELTSVHRSCR